jgi:hypothetical protein
MTTEEIEEEGEVKRTSKLSALIAAENDKFNGLEIYVYYSENNWETCEEVSLVLDENTTINQLIDSAVYKFKMELFYDNIDKKHFNVMLFKKKKKIPNDEYPLCNPESKIKDYGKVHFCLVEIKDENPKKEEKEIKKESEQNKGNIANDNNRESVKSNDLREEEMYRACSPKSCVIV